MSSLVSRVKSKLLNPIAIYRFLDAATKSITIDSQLGGIHGLYNLATSLRNLPAEQGHLLHPAHLPAVSWWCRPTRPTCCGRSPRTARSSGRSATTCR